MEKTKSDKLIAAIERLADVVDDLEETANFSTVALLTADEAKTFIVKFKKLDDNVQFPERNGAGWDLFIPRDVTIQPGETVKIPLGFACKLPDGWHALVNMRSSTWQKWGLCLSNQTGIIDSAYCGNADEWILSVYRPNSFADYPTTIPAGTRLAQFRIERDAPNLNFEITDDLDCDSRGGFGSTGD